MIAALAQTTFHPGLRSRNLTALTRAIIEAAGLNPAPDLILLPDGVGVSLRTDDGAMLNAAMCQGLTESLAWLAREWGVWIAAGHAMPDCERIVAAVTLFDPDGDPYVRHVASAETECGWTVRLTPLGRVAIGFVDRDALAAADFEDVDLLIAAPAAGGSPLAEDDLIAAATRCDCHVCLLGHNIAGPGETGDAVASCMVAPNGTILARTQPSEPAIKTVTLAIEAPSADRLRVWEGMTEGD